MTKYVQPDVLYTPNRTDLLLYEDASTRRLFNNTANFYATRNDQSIWGVALRAVAQEIARCEYFYAYDLIAKNPQYLTPSDIKRRWADPLFISSAYPSTGVFDLPDGQSDLSYRNMLVALLQAYKEGATVKAIQDVIFAYTGLVVVVQELYKFIPSDASTLLPPPSPYDQSDRNAIQVSINVGGSNPLEDIESLNQLQLVVSSLYTAIDLTKPAHVGLEFIVVFGENDNIDAYTEDISYFPQDMWSPTEPGIADNLSIIFRIVEEPPFNPMLIVAPILNPVNPQTTVAAHGRQFSGPLMSIPESQWVTLPEITFNIVNTVATETLATFTYTNANYAIHDGMQVTITGCVNGGNIFDITGKISDTTTIRTGNPPSVGNPPYSGTFKMVVQLPAPVPSAAEAGSGLVTPTLQSAYVPGLNGDYVLGIANWAPDTNFFESQIIMDSNGNTQMVVGTGSNSPPSLFGTSGYYGMTGSTPNPPTLNFTLTSSQGQVEFNGSTTYLGNITGGGDNAYLGRTFTITGFTNPGNNGVFSCLASTDESITLNNVDGEFEVDPGSASVSAWAINVNGTTTDGTLTWRMVGIGQAYIPSYRWIMLLQPGTPSITEPLPPTGEVSNWDINHPNGLVAPRLRLAWEISSDVFQGLEMN
jgi:hypothetical protein